MQRTKAYQPPSVERWSKGEKYVLHQLNTVSCHKINITKSYLNKLVRFCQKNGTHHGKILILLDFLKKLWILWGEQACLKQRLLPKAILLLFKQMG